MNLFIGIDGGQTSLKCVIVNESNHILGEGSGPGLIHLAAQGSRERYLESLTSALHQAWAMTHLPPQPVAAIGLGLTGVEFNSPEAEIVRGLVMQVQTAEAIAIDNDAYSALMGAHQGQPGVIVISGTGSIALGVNEAGQRQRVGGWGWLVGDEGSAMAIGRDGLRAALHDNDGSGPKTQLAQAFLDHFNIAHYADVKRKIYASDFGARGFAALATVVSQCAANEDTIASGLIQRHGAALATQAQAVIQGLHLSPHQQRVAPMSGAFAHVHGLQNAFTATLATIQPSAVVTSPAQSALMGAVFMAQKAWQTKHQAV